MTNTDITNAAKTIATSIHRDLLAGRLHDNAVTFDSIRCAVAGFNAGHGRRMTVRQIEDLENLTLRKFVEACST